MEFLFPLIMIIILATYLKYINITGTTIAVVHRAEARQNKAHSHTHYRAVHAPAALFYLQLHLNDLTYTFLLFLLVWHCHCFISTRCWPTSWYLVGILLNTPTGV